MKTTQRRALIKQIESLSDADLLELDAQLHSLIAARSQPEPEPQPSGLETRRKSGKRNSGEWEEIKVISGHSYRYLRFWQRGRLKSKYLGKA